MTSIRYTNTVEMVTFQCGCGVLYAISEEYMNARKDDGQTFYCPNGHTLSYKNQSNRERITHLEAEKTALQARVNSEREAREKAERKAKRMEKRAAAGLCPYCNRSFASERLQRHIHTKHPEQVHA